MLAASRRHLTPPPLLRGHPAAGGEDGERERLRRHAQAELWPLVLQRLEQFVRELGEA